MKQRWQSLIFPMTLVALAQTNVTGADACALTNLPNVRYQNPGPTRFCAPELVGDSPLFPLGFRSTNLLFPYISGGDRGYGLVTTLKNLANFEFRVSTVRDGTKYEPWMVKLGDILRELRGCWFNSVERKIRFDKLNAYLRDDRLYSAITSVTHEFLNDKYFYQSNAKWKSLVNAVPDIDANDGFLFISNLVAQGSLRQSKVAYEGATVVFLNEVTHPYRDKLTYPTAVIGWLAAERNAEDLIVLIGRCSKCWLRAKCLA